ncbi:MAG: AraC family transcriptional regulator [Phycisphaerae bacterium]
MAHEHLQNRETYMEGDCLLPEIEMLGWSRFREAAHALHEHRHPGAFEICFIVRGRVDWWAGNKVYEVGPGDVYVTQPDEPHGGVNALMHPCELYWVLVRVSSSRGESLWRNIIQGLRQIERRLFRGGTAVPEIFERLMEEHRRRGPDSGAVSRVWLEGLLLEVLRSHAAADVRRQGDSLGQTVPIQRAVRWMVDHVEESYRLEQLAQVAGRGLSQFHSRFQTETGYTPGELRTRFRVERAKLLLREQRLPVTQIAQRLGFSTSQYFATTFRKYTGLTPREYRRGVKEKKA